MKKFGWVGAMDASNVDEMKSAIRHWSERDPSLASAMERIVLTTDVVQIQIQVHLSSASSVSRRQDRA